LSSDGHAGPLRVIDYVQIGGVGLISLALLGYSFLNWRKERRKPKDE
jgi:hypothetical protein